MLLFLYHRFWYSGYSCVNSSVWSIMFIYSDENSYFVLIYIIIP